MEKNKKTWFCQNNRFKQDNKTITTKTLRENNIIEALQITYVHLF